MHVARSLFTSLHRYYNAYKRGRDRRAYMQGGLLPWSVGYWNYRNEYIRDVVLDLGRLNAFTVPDALPSSYGQRLDERVVEYPWTLARMPDGSGLVLDAGSTLNFDFLVTHPGLRGKKIVIYNLAPEGMLSLPNVSYLYGDLRETILKDSAFDVVVCISTLEHIGMNNTLLYTADTHFQESDTHAYRAVLQEFRRVLKPGGKLLLTVPYGRYENHGWLQQFDAERVADVIAAFGGTQSSITYYRYLPDGWHLATKDECADCRYFDFHATKQYEPDYAAAARAVACIEMIR